MSDQLAAATQRYPNLMAYIADRNTLETSAQWCRQLRIDEGAAEDGQFADVTREMEQAKADYAEHAKSLGHDPYPFNRAMGDFLGLPIKSNHEPEHGYYMASGVADHYRLGAARREVKALIAEGRTLSIVLARSKKTRKPVRLVRFSGAQIEVLGQTVTMSDSKRRVTLASNWSVETCMVKVAKALRTGQPYGEAA